MADRRVVWLLPRDGIAGMFVSRGNSSRDAHDLPLREIIWGVTLTFSAFLGFGVINAYSRVSLGRHLGDHRAQIARRPG